MSVPLGEHWQSVASRVTNAAHLLVGLDFDGTLAPIVDHPSKAKLDVQTQNAVKAIAGLANTSVAIVSGRALQDVRTMVGVDGLIYAGNHGLEISGPEFRYTEPTAAKARSAIDCLAAALTEGLSPITGVIVENKALTISVHFRLAAPAEKQPIIHHVQAAAAAAAPNCFCICRGKQVIDVRPSVDWHKGSAMRWIAAQLGKAKMLTLYMGDDRTDEDAFAALKDAITVKVGEPGQTQAHFHLDGPDEVRELLCSIKSLRCAKLD